jgi:hypothetical protein
VVLNMLTLSIAFAVLLAQPPAPAEPPAAPAAEAPATKPLEVTTLDAGLGPCSAEFTVKDIDGKPVYNATIHVQVRYGFLGVKRMDLEVGTNGDGRARIIGLPDSARPLVYEVGKDETTATAGQDLEKTCKGSYDLTLKPRT